MASAAAGGRTAAARKGWETRRAKAASAARSAAARKGWETRARRYVEKVERQYKRAEAAKKGWRRRRAREADERVTARYLARITAARHAGEEVYAETWAGTRGTGRTRRKGK